VVKSLVLSDALRGRHVLIHMLDSATISLIRETHAERPVPAWQPTWKFWVLIGVFWTPFIYLRVCAILGYDGGGIIWRAGYREVDLKALGNFEFDGMRGEIGDVPERFRGLNGQRVMFRGKMFGPEDCEPKLRRFQLVYDIDSSRRRQAPKVQERVFAVANKSVPVFNQDTFVEVVGTLHVRVIRDPQTGQIVSVFDMDVESAKALAW
jgi:hypothetical protein